jgi:hypothetical protein
MTHATRLGHTPSALAAAVALTAIACFFAPAPLIGQAAIGTRDMEAIHPRAIGPAVTGRFSSVPRQVVCG